MRHGFHFGQGRGFCFGPHDACLPQDREKVGSGFAGVDLDAPIGDRTARFQVGWTSMTRIVTVALWAALTGLVLAGTAQAPTAAPGAQSRPSRRRPRRTASRGACRSTGPIGSRTSIPAIIPAPTRCAIAP